MKSIIFYFLIIFICLFSTSVYAENTTNFYFITSIGSIDKYTGYSMGFRGKQFGFEAGATTTDSQPDILDYPVPHSDYRIIEKKRWLSMVFGFDFLGFINYEQISFYGGIGYYSKNYHDTQIARSNVTGWLYKQSDNIESNRIFPLSFGIQYYPSTTWGTGISIHPLRGIGLQFLLKFF